MFKSQTCALGSLANVLLNSVVLFVFFVSFLFVLANESMNLLCASEWRKEMIHRSYIWCTHANKNDNQYIRNDVKNRNKKNMCSKKPNAMHFEAMKIYARTGDSSIGLTERGTFNDGPLAMNNSACIRGKRNICKNSNGPKPFFDRFLQ